MNEQLSAWLDGELDADSLARATAGLRRQPAERRACETYWLIGDTLRGEPALSVDFSARVLEALKSEPVVLAPVAVAPQRKLEPNRWMAMAAASCAVLVVAWAGFSLAPDTVAPTATPMLAASPAPGAQARLVAAPASDVLLSGDRAYLIAHQAYAGGAPMAEVAGYVRTVSDESSGMAR
ncbi:sigma-E factor negative regulatory protein [Uliginosibacterium sp. H1]|uniref:sigma-E factor negative regulatory protein n=1 Tax=Uliginosibacterium sp. H1 TaxID=3114757 RepID=UPI002E18CC25|nr:sigma-E factor negative regulatory protein [Uliginosibacterium sp. H1]